MAFAATVARAWANGGATLRGMTKTFALLLINFFYEG
jgi:hypothetical protein